MIFSELSRLMIMRIRKLKIFVETYPHFDAIIWFVSLFTISFVVSAFISTINGNHLVRIEFNSIFENNAHPSLWWKWIAVK